MDKLQPANDLQSVNVRRYQSRLEITGMGVMIFAVWGVIRSILVLLTGTKWLDVNEADRVDISAFENSSRGVLILAFLILAAFILVDLFFRYYIMRSAKRESRGLNTKTNNKYLILAALQVLLSVMAIASSVKYAITGEKEIIETAVAVIVELTAMITLLELIHAAVMLRKCRGEQAVPAEKNAGGGAVCR